MIWLQILVETIGYFGSAFFVSTNIGIRAGEGLLYVQLISFIHVFNNFFLSAYHILGTGEMMEPKTDTVRVFIE